VAVALVVTCLGLWFGRALVDRPTDNAVRFGVSTSATVTGTTGDDVAVRYFAGSRQIASHVPKQPGHTYAVGSRVAVEHDALWPSHVSERNVPPPVGAGPRALVLLLTLGAATAAYVALERRLPSAPEDHRQRADRVGGGRERSQLPEPVHQPAQRPAH
jgi:hypothetical protein